MKYNIDYAMEMANVKDIDVPRDNLFNVQFEPRTGKVKLYFMNEKKTVLHKYFDDVVEYQRQGNPTDFYNVQKFLGIEVEKRGVYVDAVEDDNIYISLDKAEIISSMRVCKAVCSKFYLTESMLLRTVNNINRGQWTSLEWAIKDRAIYGIKIPMDLRSGKEVKIYSIPFFRNNGYVFDQPTLDFIDKLFNGEYEKHKEHIHEQVYVAEEPETGRHVLFFQRNQVLTSSSK